MTHDIIGQQQQLDEAPPPTDAELFPAYVEFAARQAVADLKREVGKTKASFMLSKFLEDDDAKR